MWPQLPLDVTTAPSAPYSKHKGQALLSIEVNKVAVGPVVVCGESSGTVLRF